VFIATVNPYELEGIVLEAYSKQGFHTQATPPSNDDGLDGILFRGSTAIGVQVKRHRYPVGSETMRNFIGTLAVHDLAVGVFMTTGAVSPKARRFAEKARVTIVEGDVFRALLLDTVKDRVIQVVRESCVAD
jgi:restriction endonuclease Mrr